MKTTLIAEKLERQTDAFFEEQSKRVQSRYHNADSKKDVKRYFDWTRAFAAAYLESRSKRAHDLESDEIRSAQKLARAYIGEGNHDFFATCVDGRNMPTVMFSKPPHVGGVLRAPAGALTGFMEGQTPGSVFIDRDSYVVKQLGKLMEERSGETIFYGLDSHVGCAARGLIHSTEGGKQKDMGLRSDVKSKWMTAKGIVTLRKELLEEGKKVASIIPVFFSYDPHIGGVIAGLELHLDHPEVTNLGYTDEVLDMLAGAGKIVRTIDLFKDPQVLSELQNVMDEASADFRTRFASSMLSNWKAVTKLYDGGTGYTYQKILKLLTTAYTSSGWDVSDVDDIEKNNISKKTLRQKAKFLLKNLLTRFSIAGASHKWPYGHHKEDLAVITDGGYAPFEKLDAFAVFSRDLNALLPNTKLTIDLIRGFRRSASITDPVPGSTLTADEFISAPVLISNKAVARSINVDTVDTIQQIDLLSVCSSIDWDNPETLSWKKANIAQLLSIACAKKQLQLPIDAVLGFVDALYELFDRMRLMMKDKYFRQMILNGNIVVMNTIVDGDRMPSVVVPFVL